MSAFIVQQKTIGQVLGGLRRVSRDFYNLKEEYKEAGYDLDSYEDMQKLGNDLYAMNFEAVGQRYGDEDRHNQVLTFVVESSGLIQSFKATQCLSYQCCEGDIPEKSKLYKLLEKTENAIAKAVVYTLPEYEESDWGH